MSNSLDFDQVRQFVRPGLGPDRLQRLSEDGTIRQGVKFAFTIYVIIVTCDFKQCGILTYVDSDEPVQPPFKLRNSN